MPVVARRVAAMTAMMTMMAMMATQCVGVEHSRPLRIAPPHRRSMHRRTAGRCR
jgi:hypothetical protein